MDKSTKQQQLDRKYSKLRKVYLEEKSFCRAKLPGCMKYGSDIHHKEQRGENLLDTSTWMLVCRSCHNWIHENPKKAREIGFLK